jgi:hypothetical protein
MTETKHKVDPQKHKEAAADTAACEIGSYVAGPSIDRIPTHKIDMSLRWPSSTEILVAGLKELNLYGGNYLYSVISRAGEDRLRTVGTYRLDPNGQPMATIYALRAEPDDQGEETLHQANSDRDWRTYVLDDAHHEGPVPIAVWDASQFNQITGDKFAFKDPNNRLGAVVAVVHLENY